MIRLKQRLHWMPAARRVATLLCRSQYLELSSNRLQVVDKLARWCVAPAFGSA